MPLPPNPDTIAYPAQSPRVILSVTDDALDFEAGLDAPLDLYVEKFMLKKTLTTHNTSNSDPTRYGLFTHELWIAKESKPSRLSLELTGADGGYFSLNDPTLIKNGFNGGVMDFYVQEIEQDAVESLLLAVSGGKGFSPPDKIDAKYGDDGGNGGSGGRVSVLYGTAAAIALNMASAILDDLQETKKKFPASFEPTTGDLIAFCQARKLDVSSYTKTLQEQLKGTDRAPFQFTLIHMVTSLNGIDNTVHAVFTQATQSSGGYGGRGSHGTVQDGVNGTKGTDGKWAVQSSLQPEIVWQSQVCFFHPVQCRMLLDKAKLYFYVDGDKNLAQCRLLLNRLLNRLRFLDTKPPSDAKLIQAYRDSELRLCVPPGPTSEEPVSIKDLRAIKSEAEATLTLLNSGKDYYGFDRWYAPRESYAAYKKIIDEELTHLKSAEEYYAEYLRASTDAAKRRDYINKSSGACQSGRATKEGVIKIARDSLGDCDTQIHSLTAPMKQAYKEIKSLTEDIRVEIKKSPKPFPDLVEALGQIFMVPNIPMIALQGTNLIYKGLSKIPKDSGIDVNDEYLIKQINNVTGDLDSIYEGYTVGKSGTVDLLDPGAAKLQLAAGKLEALVEKLESYLPSDLLPRLKKKLNDYIAIVLKRNGAVIRYNADLALIIQCYTEIAALKQTEDNLSDLERSTLATDSPMMTVAMKRIYMVLIQNLQSWLYRAQRAYNFDAMNSDNILAKFFGTIDTSQYTYALVEQAHTALFNAYSEYLDGQTKARATFNATKYYLDREDSDSIKHSKKDGKLLVVQIDPPDNATGRGDDNDPQNPFIGMTDVRLTRVRLILPGAKTNDGLLQVALKHMGYETLVDTKNKQTNFSHRTIPVDFKYEISTGKHDVPGTRDGVIGSLDVDEKYCLVGPFTTWHINISRDSNLGLDLSGVEKPYLEFEGGYRPLTFY